MGPDDSLPERGFPILLRERETLLMDNVSKATATSRH